jgi:hypothetical protein
MNELKRVRDEAWLIISNPKSTRIEKLEALKLICACRGIFLMDINEKWLSVKQVLGLRRAKQDLLEKALKRKERKRHANRKFYLKKRIAELEVNGENDEREAEEDRGVEVGAGDHGQHDLGVTHDAVEVNADHETTHAG